MTRIQTSAAPGLRTHTPGQLVIFHLVSLFLHTHLQLLTVLQMHTPFFSSPIQVRAQRPKFLLPQQLESTPRLGTCYCFYTYERRRLTGYPLLDWSKFYSPAPEIQAYIKRTAAKYDLTKHVHLNSKVIETTWDDEVGKWKIKVEINGKIQEDEADILVNGSGFLK